MRKLFFPILSCVAVLAVTGCDKTRETLGLKRSQADEFEVLDRAPLSRPPEYSLRPPMPKGEAETKAAQKAAEVALLGTKQSEAGRSEGEARLLAQSNADELDPTIREKLAQEGPAPKEEVAPGEALLFGGTPKPTRTGEVIDPEAENLRYNGKARPSAS